MSVLVSAAYVLKLAVIASQLSGYSMPTNPPPRVFFVDELEMKARCDLCSMYVGVYFDGTDNIFVNKEWLDSRWNGNDIANETPEAVIVHELTHWLQF